MIPGKQSVVGAQRTHPSWRWAHVWRGCSWQQGAAGSRPSTGTRGLFPPALPGGGGEFRSLPRPRCPSRVAGAWLVSQARSYPGSGLEAATRAPSGAGGAGVRESSDGENLLSRGKWAEKNKTKTHTQLLRLAQILLWRSASVLGELLGAVLASFSAKERQDTVQKWVYGTLTVTGNGCKWPWHYIVFSSFFLPFILFFIVQPKMLRFQLVLNTCYLGGLPQKNKNKNPKNF